MGMRMGLQANSSEKNPTIVEVARYLVTRRSFVHLATGGGLTAFRRLRSCYLGAHFFRSQLRYEPHRSRFLARPGAWNSGWARHCCWRMAFRPLWCQRIRGGICGSSPLRYSWPSPAVLRHFWLMPGGLRCCY